MGTARPKEFRLPLVAGHRQQGNPQFSAALETLEMEDTDEEYDLEFNLELEQNLYVTLEETMALSLIHI